MSVIGFYKDDESRTRPITSRKRLAPKIPRISKSFLLIHRIPIKIDRKLDRDLVNLALDELNKAPPEIIRGTLELNEDIGGNVAEINFKSSGPLYNVSESFDGYHIDINLKDKSSGEIKYAIHKSIGVVAYDMLSSCFTNKEFKDTFGFDIPSSYDFTENWAAYYCGWEISDKGKELIRAMHKTMELTDRNKYNVLESKTM